MDEEPGAWTPRALSRDIYTALMIQAKDGGQVGLGGSKLMRTTVR